MSNETIHRAEAFALANMMMAAGEAVGAVKSQAIRIVIEPRLEDLPEHAGFGADTVVAAGHPFTLHLTSRDSHHTREVVDDFVRHIRGIAGPNELHWRVQPEVAMETTLEGRVVSKFYMRGKLVPITDKEDPDNAGEAEKDAREVPRG